MSLETNETRQPIQDNSVHTIHNLRSKKLSVRYKCQNCQNSGIIDLRHTLLSLDEPVSIFNDLICENCKIGKLQCSFIDQEPLKESLKPKASEYYKDGDTIKWHFEHINSIAKLAATIFSKNELAQFSRLDSVGLFYAIENRIKKTSYSELTTDEIKKLRGDILWFREFDKNYPVAPKRNS
jgi:hypothetical protein